MLDLKPYVPYYDSVAEATIPEWAQQVAERRFQARPGQMEERRQG